MKNLSSSYRLFTEGNAPDIYYEGTDVQKDAIFKNAIKDETTLRQYLGIMGEAYLYDTTLTNRDYEQVLNEQWHRWDYVPVTLPYVDDVYRQTLKERLRQKILGGTAKFGSDEDQKKYKELVSYTKQLDKGIQQKTKEIESLEKKGEEYEKRVKELEELSKERAKILLDTEEIFNILTDAFIPEVKNKEYRHKLAETYSEFALKKKYELLSPKRE